MSKSAVDKLYDEAVAVVDALQRVEDLSLRVTAADHFRKALLLASASFFERELCSCVLAFVREKSSSHPLIENFVRNKAVARQYHTWFKWDESNANQFFGLFGPEFRAFMVGRVKGSDELKASISAFLELGNDRNKLVHQDYATFAMEKTLDEVYASHQKASVFANELSDALAKFHVVTSGVGSTTTPSNSGH